MNLLCGGGTFTFGGAHGGIGVVNAFSGYIHETDSHNGQSVGSLTEVGGGEVVQGGVGAIGSSNGSWSPLDFAGVGFDGILAGLGVGVAAGPGWIGVYYEGELGSGAAGGGAYLNTSCKGH